MDHATQQLLLKPPLPPSQPPSPCHSAHTSSSSAYSSGFPTTTIPTSTSRLSCTTTPTHGTTTTTSPIYPTSTPNQRKYCPKTVPFSTPPSHLPQCPTRCHLLTRIQSLIQMFLPLHDSAHVKEGGFKRKFHLPTPEFSLFDLEWPQLHQRRIRKQRHQVRKKKHHPRSPLTSPSLLSHHKLAQEIVDSVLNEVVLTAAIVPESLPRKTLTSPEKTPNQPDLSRNSSPQHNSSPTNRELSNDSIATATSHESEELSSNNPVPKPDDPDASFSTLDQSSESI